MSDRLLVRSMTVESDGVLSVELVDPSRRELPSWEPGAHLDVQAERGGCRGSTRCRGTLTTGSGTGSACCARPAGRGGSAYVHDTLRPGQVVGFAGPRNHFRLEPSTSNVFVAGGIGITPILPMLARDRGGGGVVDAAVRRAERSRRWRSPVSWWGTGSGSPSIRRTRLGLLDLDALLGTPRPDALVYVCGPEALLEAVEERMVAWPAGPLHLERFAVPEAPARDAGGRARGRGGAGGVRADGHGRPRDRRSSTRCWTTVSTCCTTAPRGSAGRARPR